MAKYNNKHLLKTSKACLGEGGMLHLGVADCVGQYPVVRTLTVRSTPPKDTWEETNTCQTLHSNVTTHNNGNGMQKVNVNSS